MPNNNLAILILAGKRKKNPFGEYSKAFLEINNQSFIKRTIDLLQGINYEQLFISVNPAERELFQEHLGSDLKYILIDSPEERSPVHAAINTIYKLKENQQLLVISVDTPFLNEKDIQTFISQSQMDFSIGIVNGKNSQTNAIAKRTWHKLNKNTWISGANLFLFRQPKKYIKQIEYLISFEQKRKSTIQFALNIFLGNPLNIYLFLLLLFRNISISQTNKLISNSIKIPSELLEIKNELACIDIDTPGDYNIAKQLLENNEIPT